MDWPWIFRSVFFTVCVGMMGLKSGYTPPPRICSNLSRYAPPGWSLLAGPPRWSPLSCSPILVLPGRSPLAASAHPWLPPLAGPPLAAPPWPCLGAADTRVPQWGGVLPHGGMGGVQGYPYGEGDLLTEGTPVYGTYPHAWISNLHSARVDVRCGMGPHGDRLFWVFVESHPRNIYECISAGRLSASIVWGNNGYTYYSLW